MKGSIEGCQPIEMYYYSVRNHGKNIHVSNDLSILPSRKQSPISLAKIVFLTRIKALIQLHWLRLICIHRTASVIKLFTLAALIRLSKELGMTTGKSSPRTTHANSSISTSALTSKQIFI